MASSREYEFILLQQIQQNSRQALDTLFGLYYQKLCLFADGFLGDSAEAEECVADVFVSLWKGRAHLRIDKSLKAYLYMATRYAAFARLKKQHLPTERIDDALVDRLADPCGPEQEMAHADLEASLQSALQQLPTRCRQVFLMNRMDGLPYREIGAILEISENTVEKHMSKALEALRKTLCWYRPVKSEQLP